MNVDQRSCFRSDQDSFPFLHATAVFHKNTNSVHIFGGAQGRKKERVHLILEREWPLSDVTSITTSWLRDAAISRPGWITDFDLLLVGFLRTKSTNQGKKLLCWL